MTPAITNMFGRSQAVCYNQFWLYLQGNKNDCRTSVLKVHHVFYRLWLLCPCHKFLSFEQYIWNVEIIPFKCRISLITQLLFQQHLKQIINTNCNVGRKYKTSIINFFFCLTPKTNKQTIFSFCEWRNSEGKKSI